jgi:hypothetical protein
MLFLKYIERINRMNYLIEHIATGTPREFADKLGIRRSTLFQSLQEMRVTGVDIKYSWIRKSYYYADERRIRIKVEHVFLEKKIIKGK